MPNIRSLNKMDFTKTIPNREEKIAAAPLDDAKPLDAYIANRLAKALHPDAQYLKISKIIDEGGDSKTFVLVPDGEKTKELAYFKAGSYLSISLTIGSTKLTRPYSLSSSPKESLEGFYTLTIKRAQGGLASNYILDHWAVGDVVLTSAPLGQFTYSPIRDAKTVIGLAGGSGITPFYSLAKAIEKRCPSFHLVNVLSAEEKEGCEKGFLSAELIQKYAPEGEYSLFICGDR